MLPTRRRATIVALSAVAVVVGACQASSGSTAPTYKPAPCPNPIVAGAPQFDLGAGFVGREAHVDLDASQSPFLSRPDEMTAIIQETLAAVVAQV